MWRRRPIYPNMHGEARKCAKCGSGTLWRLRYDRKRDVLKQQCLDCGYAFSVRPRDYPEPRAEDGTRRYTP